MGRGKDQGGPPPGPTLAAAAFRPLMLSSLLMLLACTPVTVQAAAGKPPTKGPTYILPMDPFANPYYAPFMASYSNVNPFSPVAAGLANSDSYAYGPSKVPWRQNMLPGMSPCEGGPCDMPGVGGTPAVGLGTVLQPPSDPNRVVGASGVYVGGSGNTYGSIYPPYGGPLRVGPPLEQSAPPPGAAIGEGKYTKNFPQFREIPLLDSTSMVTPSPLIEHDHAIYSLIGLIKEHTDQHGVSDDSELPGSGPSGGDGVSFAEVSASDLLPATPVLALAMNIPIATSRDPAPPVVPPPSEAFSAALEQYREAQVAALGALQDNAINLQELSTESR